MQMATTANYKELKEKLYSAVIADILDELGIRGNAMDHGINPLSQDMVLMGRAFTLLAADVYEVPKEPYKLELEAVDSTKEGDVIVACTSGSVSSGFWGELLSTTSKLRGCEGVVVDGLTRDSKPIIKMGYPVFVRGSSPYDSKGRTDVFAYQVPVECGGVLVNPGDIIFGDCDGIVVIPKDLEEQVIAKALEKAKGEDTVRVELSEGMSARDVFNKYGIL